MCQWRSPAPPDGLLLYTPTVLSGTRPTAAPPPRLHSVSRDAAACRRISGATISAAGADKLHRDGGIWGGKSALGCRSAVCFHHIRLLAAAHALHGWAGRDALAKITALTENLEKCHAQIEEDARKITDLTDKNEKLTDTLQTERIQHKETVNKMNADFAEEKQQMNDAHSAEVDSLNHKIADAEVEHNDYVAKLNADFAAKANETEQKHLKELADKEETHKNELAEIKEANLKSSAASNADRKSVV